MSLAQAFERIGVTQAQFGKEMRLSRSATSRLVTHCLWPKRGAVELRKAAESWLLERGATPAELMPLYAAAARAEKKEQNLLVDGAQSQAEEMAQQKNQFLEELMSIRNATLTPEARRHFNLPCNPFVDDVQTSEDVFQTPSVRYVRAALMDCAQHNGFVAVVGESGAGKSTLAEDLEERIRVENKNIKIIRPYVLAMEPSDKKGKTLRSAHVADAIAAALDPHAPAKASVNARFAQIQEMLRSSFRAGTKHLILIEEAHCMPRTMLKHLKRFLELKDGMQRMLGIALIAQPELLEILSTNSSEIREVVQRLEIIQLEPLDNDLGAYLKHKFGRFNLKLEDVLADDAVDAIRRRLVVMPRGGKASDARSGCYPLAVQNLLARAMNEATKVGWPHVTAEVIAGC